MQDGYHTRSENWHERSALKVFLGARVPLDLAHVRYNNKNQKKRKRLNGGTVPPFKMHPGGTIHLFKCLLKFAHVFGYSHIYLVIPTHICMWL